MSTQVQFRRGTTFETASFIGAVGEVTVDTSKKVVVAHDGILPGGYPHMLENGSNSLLSPGSLTSCALKFAGDIDTGIISPGPNQIALVTGGSARLNIDSAGSVTIPGNVTVSGSLTVVGGFTSGENIALIVALS
jgi:phage baseplate assembly protein gpV